MLVLEVNQKGLRGAQCLPFALYQKIQHAVSKEMAVKKHLVASVGFVSKREIRRLNKQYRKKDRVTDVLSFSFDSGEEMGEVLVCYEVAKSQAEEFGVPVRSEVVLLIVHGLLHLLGQHHKTATQEKVMRQKIAKIMQRLSLTSRL
jgi:probable rRNA maturation factor